MVFGKAELPNDDFKNELSDFIDFPTDSAYPLLFCLLDIYKDKKQESPITKNIKTTIGNINSYLIRRSFLGRTQKDSSFLINLLNTYINHDKSTSN
ncbi:MAG: hypothetical protein MJ219_00480 [Mycoplasmoidaceae bacterium]|nr:hypothetical protein [Mycoplasmoidaceae bacterium]